MSRDNHRVSRHAPAPTTPGAVSAKTRWALWAVSLTVIVLGLAIATRLPGVPYNVRELFGRGAPVGPLLAFAAALYICFGLPALGAGWLMRREQRSLLLVPLMVVAHTLLTGVLIYASVSTESMKDLVGSPVLGTAPALEYLGRFAGLFAAPSALMLLAAVWVWHADSAPVRKGPVLAQIVIVLLVAIPLWYGVVVLGAATDNLTELMAWDASPLAVAMLLGYVLVAACSGSLLAANVLAWRRALFSLPAVVLLSLLAYLLVAYGTEPFIMKYGKTFSAMQFLLSASRDHYVQGAALIARFFAAHMIVVLVIALTQAPMFRSAPT